MNDAFFASVRASAFGGRLRQGQVDGLTKIVRYALKHGYSLPDAAYVLATIHHETAAWMEPIREGARKYGTNYTDAQARRAVTAIFNKGIITRNYSLPDAVGNSFYGRGLVQITWKDNYAKFENILGIPLVSNPDLALEWQHSLDITFIGMRDGVFRKGSLKDVPDVMASPAFLASYRGMINGDVKKNGKAVADLAAAYFHALQSVYAEAAVKPVPAPTCPLPSAPTFEWAEFIKAIVAAFRKD